MYEDDDYVWRFNPEEPFGHIGTELAFYADVLTQRLADEPEMLGDESGGMPESDWLAFDGWLDFEGTVPLMAIPEEVDGPLRSEVFDVLLAFHTALPYNEAERTWLSQITYLQDHEDMPRLIEEGHHKIMVAGVRRVVSGRDLMRRWVAWHRETDEFAGQDSIE